MDLRGYIGLYSVLRETTTCVEDRRAFGLKYPSTLYPPLKQLSLWVAQSPHRDKATDETIHYLHHLNLLLGIFALVMGVVTGVGLLSYSGDNPVNILYFLSMVVLLPLLTMLFAVVSMLRRAKGESLLLSLVPAFWLERVLLYFRQHTPKGLWVLRQDPVVVKWLLLSRSQMLSWLFSVGILLALLGLIVTADIAFVWSTTLQVTPEAFHQLLVWIGMGEWMTPSLGLIEQSHYFRLGEGLDSQMVAHASTLGEWWKFLAWVTLLYAIGLRGVLWLIAQWGLKRAIADATLRLVGVERLLSEMNTPQITTHAPTPEPHFTPQPAHYLQMSEALSSHYDRVLGWALDGVEIAHLNKHFGVSSTESISVGGVMGLEEELAIVESSRGELLLYVKSWEPPIMDFVDFLEGLVSHAHRITLVPIGVEAEGYHPHPQALEVWARRLESLNYSKVWLKQ